MSAHLVSTVYTQVSFTVFCYLYITTQLRLKSLSTFYVRVSVSGSAFAQFLSSLSERGTSRPGIRRRPGQIPEGKVFKQWERIRISRVPRTEPCCAGFSSEPMVQVDFNHILIGSLIRKHSVSFHTSRFLYEHAACFHHMDNNVMCCNHQQQTLYTVI